MTDAALFHSILCGSALHIDSIRGRRDSPEKLIHMKEAIHLISTRLQDPGVTISESILFSVTHLAEFEVCTDAPFYLDLD